MPRALHILLLVPALAGWVAADLPRKVPVSQYSGLWTNSPFTSKPPPPEAGPVANPLEDYALAGVSPVTGGYRVTLLNKKKPEDRIIVETDKPRDGFKILAVIREAGSPLKTVVRMSSGSVTGTVAFEESLLALAPPPVAKPQLPPGVQPQPPGQPPQPGQVPVRQPRPRVVPPPAPPNPQAQPQVQPQVQPQAQPPGVRPGTQPFQNQQRPDRRR